MTPSFSGFRSIVTRILIVNLMAVLAFAGGLFYIEGFRSRLLESRVQELLAQGHIMAHFLANDAIETRRSGVYHMSDARGTRVRLYDRSGQLLADNWHNPQTRRFQLEDPIRAGFSRNSAITIDRAVDWLTRQPDPQLYIEPQAPAGKLPPDAAQALQGGRAITRVRQTSTRLPVLQAAVPLAGEPGGPLSAVVLLTVDTPDVIELVRRERLSSFLAFLAVLTFSVALSIYLGRTIVVPMRQLALAAHRVRLGRQRDVVVPRLPHRRDEIGGLAQALADMTAALRQRIDAMEAFAADVAHELKNPLASIRSAVEALGSVRDAQARQRLFSLIEEDVRRIDRLITDISRASRLDAELSRTRLQPVDVGHLVHTLVAARTATGGLPNDVRISADLPDGQPAMVAADADRLAQVVVNLIDNAISFSPKGGSIHVRVEQNDPLVQIEVEDEGPGVPPEARDSIFERFYSERPRHEDYGRHSGLGLSIARAIVEALDGELSVADRRDGRRGALFTVLLPAL